MSVKYPLQELKAKLGQLYQDLYALAAPMNYKASTMWEIEQKNLQICNCKEEIDDIQKNDLPRKKRVLDIFAQHDLEAPAHVVNDVDSAAKRAKPAGPGNP